jgi:Family of unknown function (DUF5681)
MSADPENTDRKHSGRFKPGQSGNPAGKPKGARHKASLLAEKLMQDDAKNIVNAVLEAARGGDMTAAKIVLDRIAPARRDNPVRFDLPAIDSALDASKAMSALLAAVAEGALTPAEAEGVARLIETFAKALEASEFEARLRALEEKTDA